ncbi:uncharacterized protein LOC125372115 [Haliotis rufescens]|uniref:uncharacterized protein LOC125372115 n=1 Tax=Haliotis rufescens TaxID=6454 RepID=UPI00201F6C03|nr:uncharacterized protein LOC125372115 [Haliotis rufescens]
MSTKHSGSKRKHLDASSSDDEIDRQLDSWARFIVIEASNHEPMKLNPFVISKAINGCCGEVKNVTRLRNGSILVECVRRQQSLNLLSLSQFANVEVAVSAHRTLNSCRGIVRDRARCLSDMSEDEIVVELSKQGVTAVKRFTRKQDNNIIKTNTYLFTFSLSRIPDSIKAGYFNIGVEVYVPNPLRCYKCQNFGHGAQTCTRNPVCVRCSGSHEGTQCTDTIKCANCDGDHLASSKLCPKFILQSKILKVKHTNNVSFRDAKILVQAQSPSIPTKSYSAAVTSNPIVKVATTSIGCQTNISWVGDQQKTVDVTSQTSSDDTITATSASQTEVLQSSHPVHEILEPESLQRDLHLTKTEKKKLKKTARALHHLEVPSCQSTSVKVHNQIEPLAMEVTPSQTGHGSRPPSKTRSPIEPP